MAKKRAGKGTGRRSAKTAQSDSKRQQQFDGEGFPEAPPKEVLDARDEYITAKRDASDAAKYRGPRVMEAICRNLVP